MMRITCTSLRIVSIDVETGHSFAADQEGAKRESVLSKQIQPGVVVKGVVYRDFLAREARYTNNARFLGAYYLEATAEERGYLASLFKNHQPRVESGTNNLILD
jgi:hypothetical protein